MSAFDRFDRDELKLVYRLLHTHLLSEEDLLDAEFFSDLQTWLQAAARADGVDVGDHARWEAWLNRKKGQLRVV